MNTIATTSAFSRRKVLQVAGAAASTIAAPSVFSQSAWPSKAIRFVVPFAPGGTSEIVARSVAAELTKQLGQSVFVENKPGGAGVVAVLNRLAQTHGLPQAITLDNGPEFTGKILHDWARQHGVKLNFTAPGKPTQNAFIESFNGKFRNECLNQHWFTTLNEARRLIEAWRQEYNEVRPHSSLGRIPPNRFASHHQNQQPQTINFSLSPA